jgi:hypothetical protein
MKQLLLLLILAFNFSISAQIDIKKKYYGIYTGVIPSYKMEMNGHVYVVDKSKIDIEIFSQFLNIRIGSSLSKGFYKVLYETDEKYVLNVEMSDQTIGEEITLFKNGKKIERKGFSPQPDCLLFR